MSNNDVFYWINVVSRTEWEVSTIDYGVKKQDC